MKKTLLFSLLILMFNTAAHAQAGSKDAYVSNNGTTFTVGQKLTLGLGSGSDGEFRYIVQIDITGSPELDKHLPADFATREVTITKIRRSKATFFSREKPTVYLVFKQDKQFQGYGINIEPALLAKEVVTEGKQ